jgi:hypothetical protein
VELGETNAMVHREGSGGSLASGLPELPAVPSWQRPDWRRGLQLALGVVWLIDGMLQLQQFMFTPGAKGFSGMLASVANGNPKPVASSITWSASVVDHHTVAANTAFAAIQILIGLGIAWRRTVKPALALSVVWALSVWWFGEGLGGVLHGTGTPLAGGPGAVLFYALLAVVLWPTSAGDSPFAAAGVIGARAARGVWAVIWAFLALLCLLGSGRAPSGVHDVIGTENSGQPGWLSAIDRHVASAVSGDGLAVAVVFAALFLVIGASVYFPSWAARATLAVAIAVAVAIWVVTENFGMILAGGATDPNSGPLLVLLALSFWPVEPAPVTATAPSAVVGAQLEMA